MNALKPWAITEPSQNHFNNDCAPISIPLARKIEDDCAPVDTPLLTKFFDINDIHGSSSLMHIVPQLYTDELPNDYTLVFSPFSPAGPVVLNPTAFNRLQQFHTPQVLTQAVDYTFASQNLLVSTETPPNMTWGKATTLTAWLHITNACNLNCPYCYVRKSNEKMSDEVGVRVIDTIFQSAKQNGFKSVKLKYAGGEAALHFKQVQRLHRYANQLADRIGLDLHAVILSNGTLWTPDMANWLRENNVKLMISLDGVGTTHDAMRPTITEEGSFAKIEYVVDTVLLPANIRPDISITISGKNSDTVADAVEWAIQRDLPFSLNFYRENTSATMQPDLQLEEARIITGMRRAYQRVAQYLPTRPFLNGLLDKAQMNAHTHTCGVGQNYLVFSHTGLVSQCQMHLSNNNLVPNGVDPLTLVKNDVIPQINVEQKEGCQTCAWRYRCAGGCPIETYRATGRYDVKSPHCNIYTALFPEAFRLEGLRLLKLEGMLE